MKSIIYIRDYFILLLSELFLSWNRSYIKRKDSHSTLDSVCFLLSARAFVFCVCLIDRPAAGVMLVQGGFWGSSLWQVRHTDMSWHGHIVAAEQNPSCLKLASKSS